jgi:hypothetical protein
MVEIIDRFVNWLLAIVLVAAVVSLTWTSVYIYFRDSVMVRRRLSFTKVRRTSGMEQMLKLVSGEKASMGRFRLFSIALGVMTLLLLITTTGMFNIWMLMLAIAVGFIPMAVQWMRLHSRRTKGSFEGIELVTVLANAYVVCGKSMTSALDMTVTGMKTAPYSKYVVARLAKQVKTYKTESDLLEAMDNFIFAYRTEWAQLLAFSIFNAVIDGLDVSSSLASLLEQFQRANQVQEKSKRNNRETFVVMLLLVPLSYVGMMAYGASMFGKSVWDILRLQVTSPMGIKLLIVIITLSVACLALTNIVTKPKYDL